MAQTLQPKINTEAFSSKKPKIGDTKTEDGVQFIYKASGWSRINKKLAEQKEKSKKQESNKKEASKVAKATVAELRKNYNGKAGLPRTNTA